jgi:hypothetical protein
LTQSRAFAMVSLRILGIYFLVESVLSLQNLAPIFAETDITGKEHPMFLLASLSATLILLISGTSLILFAAKISTYMLGTSQTDHIESSETLPDLQPILFSAVGALIVAGGIQRSFLGVSYLVNLIAENQKGLFPPKVVRDAWVTIILSLIQLLLGVGLFVGGRGLSSLWRRLRTWPRASA